MATEKVTKTFKDITGHNIPNTSQLNLFNILKDVEDNEEFFNIFRAYTINENILNSTLYYETHEADNDEWFENVSYGYYGDPSLWWVIPLMNNILNPFEEINAGDLFKILKSDYIYQLLQEIKGVADQ